ncbi:MAG: DNA-binding protein [Candidatus Muproteobacteria bacterium RBG_16_60_9]|uniref:DNA-binding protein n=1 Tax=Candidatus Muproteobacteria bacterium RBG_16_60_9 TaxID=1817755 RepID=A0A1F6UWD9_9PROT|nr:MAG: DNA-binding protein [Candidatus Muproteobacteria bacterium RBG_16_60_9]
MPLYECLTVQGTLTSEQRRRIAEAVTSIHVEETGAPATFVHVTFPELAPQHAFTAAKNTNPALIRGAIRKGRPQSIRQALIRRIFDAYVGITGAPVMSVLVAIGEVSASSVMEGGEILPEPNKEEEDAWLAKTAKAT